jgi:two-component system, NtrC family, nitrogen regulation sensor histidine kinase NtrY
LIQALKKAAYAHGYLIITAAWLYTISFIFTNYWSYSSSPASVQRTLQNHIAAEESEFEKIVADTAKIKALISVRDNAVKTDLLNRSSGFFIYRINNSGALQQLYWNTNSMLPVPEDLEKPDGDYYADYQNGSFELEKRTFMIRSNVFIVTGMIPVRWNYFINNKYLENGFAGYPLIEKLYRITESKEGLPVENSKGQTLFRIEKRENVSADQPDFFSIALRVLAIVFLMMFINSIANDLVLSVGFIPAFAGLLSIIFILRLLTYEFPFPFDFRKLELFYGGLYASSMLNPSLGDLLINSILIFWIATFTKFNYKNRFLQSKILSQKQKNIVAAVALIIFAWFTLSAAGIIGSVVSDSTLSFDVTNFFGLSIYIFICLIIISFIIISFYHISHLLLNPAKIAGFSIYLQMAIVSAAGLFLLSFNVGNDSVEFKVVTILWLIVYMFIMKFRQADVSLRILNSSFFMVWAAFFTASITTLVISQNREKEIVKRYTYAENLAEQIDPAGQGYLKVTLTNLSDDFLASNFYRFYSYDDNKFLKDSIVNEIFSGYLINYATHIYTFNNEWKPLYNEDSTSYNSLQSTINVKAKPVDGADGLYYFQNNTDKFSYLYKKDIWRDKDTPVGAIIILLSPKQNKSEALYPELFKQTEETGLESDNNYAYAVSNNGRLINSLNNYEFADTIMPGQAPKLNYEIRDKKNEYNELWYNAGNKRVIVIAKKDTWLLQYITFFAYLFCVFIAIVVLFYFGGYIIKARFSWTNFKKIFVFNIRTQIHATIIFISLFSFVIIGVVTISFFITRFDSSNRDRLSNSIKVIDAEIENYIKGMLLPGESFNPRDPNIGGDVEKKITEISEIHDVDVNFYDSAGNLLISSQPVIYNNQVLSDKMNARAYDELHYKKNIEFVNNENIGNDFSYLSSYIPVKNESGNSVAYLNIPYLNSQSELNQEISNFLVTLIDLNALIFVLAGAIALVVTNRITSSFSFIGAKMKEINLGKTNEEVVWKKNDEIGALVNEYNRMVQQLEASAKLLARNEREEAWREMARQVAHEIKNPLTPMKLSIQYLERAIDDGHSNVKELSQQVTATLVEQIDQLSKIAGDFSQFANIGNADPQKFDISEVLQALVNLYNAYPGLNIKWEKQEGAYKILSDKTQINRMFTNLIKNAIEASAGKRTMEILIKQYKEEKNVVVSLADNGTGIPEGMRGKIFAPNFTTKTSGTGLGLAICRGIAEKADGKIWFETNVGIGSIFYVSLPLI